MTENILLQLFVIFAAAKIGGELFERINQPPVIGELLVGIALGPRALGVIGESEEVLEVLQTLGAIVLLFMVGLDTRPSEIKMVGNRALSVGALGIALPFAGGLAFIYATEGSLDEAMFVGAAMVATSVGITARVLSDLGVVREIESRIILGAAVVDDVLGLLVLALVSGVSGGDLSVLQIVVLAASALGFVGIVAAWGTRVVEAAAPRIEDVQIKRGPLAVAVAVCLGLSALAEGIGLAAIIGAFLAGMAFSELRPRWDLEDQVEPLYELFVPFFFVVTGSLVDPAFLVDPATIGLVAAITVLAILGKLIGCGGAAWGMGRRSMLMIGVGMVPRGEVGIIVATVGLSAGMIDNQLYGIVVAMSILTTLLVPPVLKVVFAERVREMTRVRERERTEQVEGIGG